MKTEIFKSNPNLKEVHMTSDGQCFYSDNDAKMHAKTLEDKAVELVMNPTFLIDIEVVDEEKLDGGSGDAPALEDMTKAELVQFAKLNYNVELNQKVTKPELLAAIDDLIKKDEASKVVTMEDKAPVVDAPVDGGTSIEDLGKETKLQE
ncbi:hypothetical protein [Flavobacterium sp.]|uniref:hypothetical protein n=1 Tax=Flavobacterium sp. TaxID=239 RepID=UPI0040487CD7